jgi:hypothetical protein
MTSFTSPCPSSSSLEISITDLPSEYKANILALLLMLATVYIYDLKRKGRLNIRGKIRPDRKSKSDQ